MGLLLPLQPARDIFSPLLLLLSLFPFGALSTFHLALPPSLLSWEFDSPTLHRLPPPLLCVQNRIGSAVHRSCNKEEGGEGGDLLRFNLVPMGGCDPSGAHSGG